MCPSFQMLLEQAGFAALAITDNGPGDQDALAGVLSFMGSYGTFNVTVTTGVSKPVLGSPTTAVMEVHYSVLTSAGGTLQITFGDTDFTVPGQTANPLTLTSELGGTLTPGSVTSQAFADAGNVQFGMATTPGPHGPITTSPYSDSRTVTFNRGSGPYSLTSKTTITMGAGGIGGADHVLTVTGVPVQPAALGDRVFEDLNANGIQDTGEPGIPDVTVKLLQGGVVIATTTTNASGNYLFSNLAPGTYQVMFNNPNPALFMFSPANQGSNDAVDSDANPADGMTGNITLVSGQTDLTNDAGLFRKAKLGDFVWNDLDGDGLQDANEPGVNGVTVKLQDPAGNVLATTTTSGNGMYMFNDLLPGSYKVMFVAPAGFTFTTANVGANDAIDSDAVAAMGGMTQVVTLQSGQQNLTLDAGLRASGEQLGNEGGTPGYWKNNAEKHGAVAWGPTGYSPNQTVASVFSRAGMAPYTALGNLTLLQALGNGGGGANALLRQAVAALLNAAHPLVHYPITSAQIIQQVNAALDSQNASVIEALKNQLDQFNNLRHPLNQQGQRT